MKKICQTVAIFLLTVSAKSKAQDILNPYITQPIQSSVFNYSNSTSGFQHNFIFPQQSINFTGEYEMSLKFFDWYKLFLAPLLSGVSPHPPLTFAISFNYEVVSFPFLPECTYSGNCGQMSLPCSSHVRILTLPIEDAIHFTFNSTNHFFQYYTQVQPSSTDRMYLETPFYDFFDEFSTGNLGQIPHSAFSLASGGFLSNTGLTQGRHVLPHSIIRYSINIHCGPNNSFPVIKTIRYTYDNTRGRMRFYPFNECNTGITNGSDQFDVLFYPEILYSSIDNDYNLNSFDPALILPNGTINYFPLDKNLLNTCSNVVTPDPITSFYDPLGIIPPNFTNNTFNSSVWSNFINSYSTNIFPSPYALLSSPLRGIDGMYFAGMGAPDNSGLITFLPGIRHSYFIDQNTDLNIINPTEKEIYNPSEATITASNFVFPQDYTFKTIRGVYPSEAEALASRIIENGCDANTDLREVPVVTDLTTENTTDAINFPLSALPATQHLYASRYYLENNSKLTVQQCVRLFDCTFDVKQGATLQFDDYPAHYGKEDYSYDRTNTRFKIQTLGGAVLRNYNDVQYLQNVNITQTLPLHYKAIREIYAGSNVDPDQDIPKQDYVAQSGSKITLQAGEVIYLKEGFHAMSGSNVHITPTSPGGSAGPDIT